MIVYVEANFLLELARRQEEEPAADSILRHAETKRIKLALPSISFFEPFPALDRLANERAKFDDLLRQQRRELDRTQPHKGLASVLRMVGEQLLTLKRTEMDRLAAAVLRTLTVPEAIPLTPSSFAKARTLQTKFDLSLQDAIVLSSVGRHSLDQPTNIPKCFISRNSKDFDDPEVKSILAQGSCRYISKFVDGLSYIEHALSSK